MRWSGLGVLALGLLCACPSRREQLTFALALLPSELPAYRAVLDDFERHAGVRVTTVPQQYADIRRALAAETVAEHGTLDLVELDVYSLTASAPHVTVLDPAYLQPDLDAFEPQAVAAGDLDGLRFLPHRLSWQALIYNHAVIAVPPSTWAELLALARAHPGKVGIKGALYEGLTCDVLPFVWSASGSGTALDDAGARVAFDFLAQLAPYLHPHSATFKEATIAEAMARGEIVLHLNWPFAMSLYASQGLAPDPIRSAPIPYGPDGRATVLGGGYIAIPRYAPHREAALQLARFLLSQPVQARLHRMLGWFSGRRDIPMEDQGTLVDGFATMRADVRPRPERVDYPLLSRRWQQAARAVLFEHTAPDAALRAAGADGG